MESTVKMMSHKHLCVPFIGHSNAFWAFYSSRLQQGNHETLSVWCGCACGCRPPITDVFSAQNASNGELLSCHYVNYQKATLVISDQMKTYVPYLDHVRNTSVFVKITRNRQWTMVADVSWHLHIHLHICSHDWIDTYIRHICYLQCVFYH